MNVMVILDILQSEVKTFQCFLILRKCFPGRDRVWQLQTYCHWKIIDIKINLGLMYHRANLPDWIGSKNIGFWAQAFIWTVQLCQLYLVASVDMKCHFHFLQIVFSQTSSPSSGKHISLWPLRITLTNNGLEAKILLNPFVYFIW